MRLTLVMLNAHVSGEAVELEGEAEDVVVVRRVSHHERAVGLIANDLLRRLAADGAPIPSVLGGGYYCLLRSEKN